MGLFKIINKVIKVLYRLDLLLKIKIYLVYYIAILEPVYGNYELLVYKQDIYKDIKTKREFKTLYRKGTGVLSESILGNIKKEKSKVKKLAKSDK